MRLAKKKFHLKSNAVYNSFAKKGKQSQQYVIFVKKKMKL